jgi:hypothetical protein
MSPDDINDISSGLPWKKVYPENDVWRCFFAIPITTLEAKRARTGAPSGPLRRKQGLTEYSSRPRL